MEQLVTRVRNLDCEHDAAAIERGFRNVEGVTRIDVYPRTAKVVLHFDPQRIKREDLLARLEELGFPPVTGMDIPRPPKLWENPRVLMAAAAGVFLGIAWYGQRVSWPVSVTNALLLISALLGMRYFGEEALRDLIQERRIGIELLMSLAAVAAFFLGEWFEGASLAFLYGIAEALESYTEDKTRAAIRALMSLAPKTAVVRRNGKEETIPAEEIQVGDIFIVRPGESIPTDGVVIHGKGYVDESPLTGESMPVFKEEGARVFAGTINKEGILEVRATHTAADNTLARMIAMVEEAQRAKGRYADFVERFGRKYSPAVLLAGIVIAVAPPLLFGAPWTEWILRGTIFIVAAAPCALVIGVPMTFVTALGTSARRGVLIKGGVYMEELARIRLVAADKTGTLSRGRPMVTDVIPADGVNEEALLRMAAAVEVRSEHPLAAAVVTAAENRVDLPEAAREVQAIPGVGIWGRWNGSIVAVGRVEAFPTYTRELQEKIDALRKQGKTVVTVAVLDTPPARGTRTFQQARVIGLLALRDEPRPDAREMIQELHRLGVRVAMLTGDHKVTAQAIAKDLGIDEVYAELHPEDKVTKIQELREREEHVAMVGDGINDAPALAAACVGIAMGAAGTDAAMESADVVLMADDLTKVPYAVRLSRWTRQVMWQNVAVAMLVVLGLSSAALAGLISLSTAVFIHEMSEFIVVGNALRLLRG